MCGGGCCPDPVFAPDPQSFLASTSACGNWCYPCGSTFRTLWEKENSFTGKVSGTVTINYQGGCDNLLGVVVYDSQNKPYDNVSGASFVVPKAVGKCLTDTTGNTVSRAFPDISRVEIVCNSLSETSTNCFGKYCLDLHYTVTV
ncbi:S-Ena type endospore appendage [Sporosarcina sp.]|uniref:S-Ena type endospore appendage n=1 Tax=Sporosarcina sp. TaxID=49982 RepID=UPI00260A6069|nr:S-Ena type endospore appendage [Sporosarcina sp.]